MEKNKPTKYTMRYISRITVEAKTPLSIGCGRKDMLTDSLVATDMNGLPYLPGTSIAGVLRSALNIGDSDDTAFGFQSKGNGKGSRLIITDGVMVGSDGKPVDGLQTINWEDEFYTHFKVLPVRQHVSINEKGTAKSSGKFDEQIVYKGTRFCFEIEMISSGEDIDKQLYEKLTKEMCSNTFRIGSDTRNGFGLLEVISIKQRDYDLTLKEDLYSYALRSAALNVPLEGATEIIETGHNTYDWQRYILHLKPENFFLFSSGTGDDEADITPVKEKYIYWMGGKPAFSEAKILIPATSVKGALAHRTAYHWNKLKGYFADNKEGLVGDKNPAVVAIFGKSGNEDNDFRRGNIMMSDIFMEQGGKEKIINHVAIDRFTGGSLAGALFTEKAVYGEQKEIAPLTIDVLKKAIEDNDIRNAFETALQDVTNGLLPLGGGVNRGNGMFFGKIEKE